jgi:lipoprotein-anchoring transpeptidase ErfK/SrfK
MIIIDTKTQTLTFKNKVYKISTAKNGLGEMENSSKTPTGKFKICEKIGSGEDIWTIFKARKPVGIWDKKPTKEDLILSRILWLDGMEKHNKNTKDRFIYIHGTNDEKSLGVPNSIGCIRMKNSDIIQLFDLVKIDDKVFIGIIDT